MTVTDTVMGNVKTYSNPSGQLASVGDTEGFLPGSTGSPLLTARGTPFGVASSATIGSTGGTLRSADGRLTLSVPPGASSAVNPVFSVSRLQGRLSRGHRQAGSETT